MEAMNTLAHSNTTNGSLVAMGSIAKALSQTNETIQLVTEAIRELQNSDESQIRLINGLESRIVEVETAVQDLKKKPDPISESLSVPEQIGIPLPVSDVNYEQPANAPMGKMTQHSIDRSVAADIIVQNYMLNIRNRRSDLFLWDECMIDTIFAKTRRSKPYIRMRSYQLLDERIPEEKKDEWKKKEGVLASTPNSITRRMERIPLIDGMRQIYVGVLLDLLDGTARL